VLPSPGKELVQIIIVAVANESCYVLLHLLQPRHLGISGGKAGQAAKEYFREGPMKEK